MIYRELGKTGMKVSELSFGTWAIGGSWGKVNDDESLRALAKAIDEGVNFFDTADVYGDGHSEELLAKATAGKEDQIHIATKFCRKGDIHELSNYSESRIREYCEASLKRLGRERIDLYQIHCAPQSILEHGQVFEVLDKLQTEGKIRSYGVSVETVEEGLLCLRNPNVGALQVIFNILRQKPLAQILPKAYAQGVGILVRLPLASGLLTGKMTAATTFEADDHRSFNENGEQFNIGETFGGLGLKKGAQLSEQLAWIAEGRGNMARAALRWILDQKEVSCVIPGFKSAAQVENNLAARNVPAFNENDMMRLNQYYTDQVASHIRGPY